MGALAIMHLDMYLTAWETMVRLGHWADETGDSRMLECLTEWPMVYNIASVIANRACPLHTNKFGHPQWLDLLLTVGEYSDLRFVLPTIGYELQYNPGTVLALSGQLLEHGVSIADGERGVVSFYMHDNVHEFMDVVRCNYMEYQNAGREL